MITPNVIINFSNLKDKKKIEQIEESLQNAYSTLDPKYPMKHAENKNLTFTFMLSSRIEYPSDNKKSINKNDVSPNTPMTESVISRKSDMDPTTFKYSKYVNTEA